MDILLWYNPITLTFNPLKYPEFLLKAQTHNTHSDLSPGLIEENKLNPEDDVINKLYSS